MIAATTGEPAQRWRELLAGRAVPEHVLAHAPCSPYHQTPDRFAVPDVPDDTPSRRAGLELLGEGGTVLDVGCGPGAASLALSPPATHVTGVDDATDMLAAFTRACLERDVPWQGVLGTWPAAAAEAGRADVVVAHHVVYNAPDLVGFVTALAGAARRGVVVELTAEHPLAWMDPLWRRFHGVERPAPPTADDALAVITELVGAPTVTRWRSGPSRAQQSPPEERVRRVRRRLCLDGSRDAEVADALAQVDTEPPEKVTIGWPTGR